MLRFLIRVCMYLLVLLVLATPGQILISQPAMEGPPSAYIVQAHSAAAAASHVGAAGGVIRRELAIINAVSATLGPAAAARLRTYPGLRLYADAQAHASDEFDAISAASAGETYTGGGLLYPAVATNVDELHKQKVITRKTECKYGSVIVSSASEPRALRGWGVTVAVVDSGFMRMASSGDWKYHAATGTLVAQNSGRCIVYRDFVGHGPISNSDDRYGHGTHVVATIADQAKARLDQTGLDAAVGVAPEVNLLVARALGADGSGRYADIIAAIEWIVQNRVRYNVRVLNLSLYSPVNRPYWDDPLNQAVMRAWQEGIVVVAAAGNGGPAARTIGAPGNVPYLITVGALTSGRYTTSGSDELASYSGRGPTESAFVKPDLVIPASWTLAPMPDDSLLAASTPASRKYKVARVDFGIGAPSASHTSYQLSGTSMAAAQVSGLVALMLQKDPALTNDQVKYRLMTTARQSIDPGSRIPRYSIWEQGAGLVDAPLALNSTSTRAANAGLDIARDLDPASPLHYWGYTTWDATRNEFRLFDPVGGQLLESWAGGSRSWAGSDPTAWAGGSRSWAGSDPTAWAGGSRSWAGSDRVYVFDGEPVAQGNIVTDDPIIRRVNTSVYLPLLCHP